MGQGSHLTIVNGTGQKWERTKQHSYQLNHWDFPQTIAPYSVAQIYIEWQSIGVEKDSAAEVNYQINGTNSFQIRARAENGYDIIVDLSNVNSLIDTTRNISLGWKHDGIMQMILSESNGRYTSNGIDGGKWMQQSLSQLGEKTLKELCLLGSHDAGMSIITSATNSFVNKSNALTQSLSVGGQLDRGARYFDIRPVISAGAYYTGHYTKVAKTSWQGANGQSIAAIVEEVNDFSAKNKELIILKISNTLNTDVGNFSYRSFNQEEWEKLFVELQKLKNLYSTSNTSVNFNRMKLNELIGKQSAVIVVFESGVSLGGYYGKGFYKSSNLSVSDEYSNTNNLEYMIEDQLNKMKIQTPQSALFLLSWTLTQSVPQVIAPVVSIEDMADKANQCLSEKLYPATDRRSAFPNIIYMDYINADNVGLAVAMAVNSKMEPSQAVTKEEKKHWEDATAGKSHFGNLVFGNRHWKTCTIVVKGRDKSQNFDVQVNVDGGKLSSYNFNLDKDEQRTITETINKNCKIDVIGSLNKAGLFNGASGTVDVTCVYVEQ